MDAVAKPNPFEVNHKFIKIFRFPVAFEIKIYGFQCFTNQQVIFIILVICNIPAAQCCLAKVINQCLLLQAELFKSRHLVS